MPELPKVETIKIDSPTLAKLGGFSIRYAVRFIELPYLLILSVGMMFSFLILFGDTGPINRGFSYLVLAPIVGFKTALNPSLEFHGGAKEMIITASFWLFIYHLFWELGYLITKKPFFRNGRVRTKSLSWLLIAVNAIFFVSASFTGDHSLNEKITLFVFLLITTFIGLVSLNLGNLLRSIADKFTAQNP